MTPERVLDEIKGAFEREAAAREALGRISNLPPGATLADAKRIADEALEK